MVPQGVDVFESEVGEDRVVQVNMKLQLLVLRSDKNPLQRVDLSGISGSQLDCEYCCFCFASC